MGRFFAVITILFFSISSFGEDKKKLFPLDANISGPVVDAIKRNTSEISKNIKNKTYNLDQAQGQRENVSLLNFDILKQIESSIKKPVEFAEEKIENFKLQLYVRGDGPPLISSLFEIQALSDSDQRIECENFCHINVFKNEGLKRYKVFGQNIFPTTLELSAENKSEDYYYTFTRKAFMDLFAKENHSYDVEDYSYLLIQVVQNFKDIEIDARYVQKIFFDRDFNVLQGIDGSSFILFMGINPGLVNVISYSEKSTFSRPTFLPKGELLSLNNEIEKFDIKSFEVYLLGPMAEEPIPFSFSEDSVVNFSNEQKPTKVGTNNYQFYNITLNPSGRYYFDLKEDNSHFVVSTSFNSPIVLPNQDFQEFLEHKIGAESSDPEFCMTQLNFSQKLKEIKYNSEDYLGPGDIIAVSLLSDGSLSDAFYEGAKKIIFYSYKLEAIYYKAIFQDGSSKDGITFCSPGNRIIDQN